MSAAEENGVGGTPGQAVDGGRQRVDRDTTVTDDDVQQASAAPPWQRATSTVRTAAATPADSADLEYRTYGSDGYLDDAQHDLASHVAGDEPTQVVEHATNGVPNRGSTSVAVESPAEQTSTLRPVVDRPAAGRLFGDGSARTSVNVAAASASGSGGSGADSAGTTSAVGVPVEERKRDTPTALR
ncbi:MAG: hypothetical protein J2O49_11385, partial [Sciscionella sp.]|nr:hypothetical protein [Sciscionella sp.]